MDKKITNFADLRLACSNLVNVCSAVFRDTTFINDIFRYWLIDLQNHGENTLSEMDLDVVIQHISYLLSSLAGALRDDQNSSETVSKEEIITNLQHNLVFDLKKIESSSLSHRMSAINEIISTQSKLFNELKTSSSKSKNPNTSVQAKSSRQPSNSKGNDSSKERGWCLFALMNHFLPNSGKKCNKHNCIFCHEIPTTLTTQVIDKMLESVQKMDKNPDLKNQLLTAIKSSTKQITFK